jgi:polyisoprenoid-binding protein YceI
MTEANVREVDGIALPPEGTYAFDESDAEVGFVARHMLSKVRGRFTSFDGWIEIAERPEDSRVEVEIEAASIRTDRAMRDDHLRSSDFLDVAAYPTLRFESREVRLTGGNTLRLVGDLTIKDVTREVVLDARFLGSGSGVHGGARVAFSAATEIDREDWGMTWNVAFETGGLLVGKQVEIEVEVEAFLSGES